MNITRTLIAAIGTFGVCATLSFIYLILFRRTRNGRGTADSPIEGRDVEDPRIRGELTEWQWHTTKMQIDRLSKIGSASWPIVLTFISIRV